MPITLVPLSVDHAPSLEGVALRADEIAQFVADRERFRHFAVIEEGACIGVVGLQLLPNLDPEMIVSIVPEHRKKGYATAAVVEMLRFAFEEMEVSRVYAKCLAGRPSNKVAANAGFSFVKELGGERFYEIKKAAWRSAHGAMTPLHDNVPNPVEEPSKDASLRTWHLNGFLPVEALTKSEARARFKQQRPIPRGAKIE